MADPIAPERVIAALAVAGWPDDRAGSAHVEDDGYEITPAGHYWELMTDIIQVADAAQLTAPMTKAARVSGTFRTEVPRG